MKHSKIEYLEFAKGFAILSIVIFHYSQPYVSGIWEKAIQLGGTGVHLFFILSGFGLGLSKNIGSVSSFYKRRFFKILLPYYILIIIIFIINLIYPIYKNDGLYALGGHIFLYKMFDENIIGSFGYHFWFLSTLTQLYLLFPLLAYLKQKTGVKAFLLTSILLSATYWTTISQLNLDYLRTYNSFFFQYLWEFSFGMILAHAYTDNNIKFWEQKIILLIFVAIIGITTMGVMAIQGGRIGQTFNDIPASLGYLSLSILIYKLFQIRMNFLNKVLIYIGGISYELYLIHMLVFVLATQTLTTIFSMDLNLATSLFYIIPISIFMSYFFIYLNKQLCKITSTLLQKI